MTIHYMRTEALKMWSKYVIKLKMWDFFSFPNPFLCCILALLGNWLWECTFRSCLHEERTEKEEVPRQFQLKWPVSQGGWAETKAADRAVKNRGVEKGRWSLSLFFLLFQERAHSIERRQPRRGGDAVTWMESRLLWLDYPIIAWDGKAFVGCGEDWEMAGRQMKGLWGVYYKYTNIVYIHLYL